MDANRKLGDDGCEGVRQVDGWGAVTSGVSLLVACCSGAAHTTVTGSSTLGIFPREGLGSSSGCSCGGGGIAAEMGGRPVC